MSKDGLVKSSHSNQALAGSKSAENSSHKGIYPILPLKNSVIFPGIVTTMVVGRNRSILGIREALKREDQSLVILTQKSAEQETPAASDLYQIGTSSTIKSLEEHQGMIQLYVQGRERMQALSGFKTEPYYMAEFEKLPLPSDDGPEVEALERNIDEMIDKMDGMQVLAANVSLRQLLVPIKDKIRKVYMVASLAGLEAEKCQKILEAPSCLLAMRLLNQHLSYELKVLELKHAIETKTARQIGQENREYILRQQLKAIQNELGDTVSGDSELDELSEKIHSLKLPAEAQREVQRELQKLRRLGPAAPDYQLTRSYLELVCELPWNTESQTAIDLSKVKSLLDHDHFDLEDIKERIVEYFAILKLNPQAKSPIICFLGPPGVGKTSLGESIARALDRKFERLSLGGVSDESELRGHRRTYIGSMPGRIIQAIRRSEVKNPVIMLDEIDKLGRDYRGDPAAALLEILDPEQNKKFRDNYLDVPFDLSKVLFLTTANMLDTVPRPLLDRLEILRLSGYTQEEKLAIARRHLIPRQLQNANISLDALNFSDEALKAIITGYTREAGLRELERSIASVIRKIAVKIAKEESYATLITAEMVSDALGIPKYHFDKLRKVLVPGVAPGLAWTEYGGDVLYVEAISLPKKDALILTGHLGEIMKESAHAAKSCVQAIAHEIGIPANKLEDGLHIHIPTGAIPKDGPSAGMTMAIAITSLLLGKTVRADTAMTGEISLSGLILAVGGIKEKVLAAHRAGIKQILLPEANRSNLKEIPASVQNDMAFEFVETFSQALEIVFPS